MFRSDEKTVVELLIGNVIYGVIGMAILLLFPNRIYNLAGFVEGVVISSGMTIHMYTSLRKSLEMDEGGALKNTRLTYGVRAACVLAVFAVISAFNLGNIITGVIGLFALKVSAYFQPLTHKILERKFTGKGR